VFTWFALVKHSIPDLLRKIFNSSVPMLVVKALLLDNTCMTNQTLNKSTLRNRLILLAIGGLALYVIIPQISGFQDSIAIVKKADVPQIMLAVCFSLLTFMIAAATYTILALRPLKYPRTVLAQMAAMFVNRLLPAGIGGIGANYVYLRKAKHTLPEAASVVTANNLLGFAGHITLTLILVAVFHDQLPAIGSADLQQKLLFVAAAAVLFILLLIFAKTLKGKILSKVAAVAAQLIAYRRKPHKLFAALGTSILLTLTNVVCLWFCVLSLNVPLSFVAVLIVFTMGVVIGVATPTPGGLGGVEAGLVAGMLAYGVSGAVALAVALTYRFINYWLSMAIGAGAFVICRQRNIL